MKLLGLLFLISAGLIQPPSGNNRSDLPQISSAKENENADKNGEARVVSGHVYSAETFQPLSHVHVRIPASGSSAANKTGSVTDSDGYFELPVNSIDPVIRATRIGYAVKSQPVENLSATTPYVVIFLQPETIRMDEVIINAAKQPGNGSHRYTGQQGESTEAFIGRLDGVGMIKRANYAWEPAIRGMSAGRVTVLIDDVKMVSACVDRMDPVTSYVETENLEKVEVSRGNFELGNGNRPGGSLNLVTSRPAFDRGYFGRIDFGAQHNAAVQKYHVNSGYSNDRTAFQTSFSFRDAGDFREGGGSKLNGSGYRKMNLKMDADHKLSDNFTGRFTYIGDLAKDIGYPALMMDTREARSHLISYDFVWRPTIESGAGSDSDSGFRPGSGTASDPGSGIRSWSVSSLRIKPYHTRVDHWMDDYTRDVTSRDVMPDMHMPMYGYTRTTGLLLNSMIYRDAHLLDLGLHLHRLDAFADMKMEPLDTSESDMYLLNIGNVRMNNSYFSAAYSWLPAGSWSFSGNVSLELSNRSLNNSTAADLFRAEYPGISTDRLWKVFSGSVSANYTHSDRFAVIASLSDGKRLPSHLEHYGYYIYNPVDDYFYHGNPGLSPERSSQAEVNTMVATPDRRAGAEAAVFVNYLQNYIGGGSASDHFRQYTNFESAIMAGGELSLFLEPLEFLRLTAGGSYVYAENLELREPLPMIPPLEGFVEVSGQSGPLFLKSRIRMVAGQSRIADRSTLEEPSDAFLVADLEGQYRASAGVTLHSGIRNVFDTWYREHTTPGHMPAPGRDIFLQIRYAW